MDFLQGERVLHKRNFPLFPMTVLENSSLFVKCRYDFGNDFIDSIQFLSSDLKKFPIQNPDYCLYIKFDSADSPTVDSPFFHTANDMDLIAAFLEEYFKQFYNQLEKLGQSKEEFWNFLSQILDSDTAIQRLNSAAKKLIQFPPNYKNYYHIEYSYEGNLLWFDWEKVDTDSIIATTFIILINLLNETPNMEDFLSLIIGGI